MSYAVAFGNATRKAAIEITCDHGDTFSCPQLSELGGFVEKHRGSTMTNSIRKVGTFLGILCAISLWGCASADDGALPPADETAEASSQALAEATLAADAADCDSGAQTGSYEEFASMLENDGSLEAASTCRRVCACCRRGNRFCCSHCKFCSGPIGPYGVSTGELAR